MKESMKSSHVYVKLKGPLKMHVPYPNVIFLNLGNFQVIEGIWAFYSILSLLAILNLHDLLGTSSHFDYKSGVKRSRKLMSRL